MSAKTFAIRTYKDIDVTFNLSVCRTRKGMVAAIKKHIPKSGNDSAYPCGNTQGMFVPTVQKYYAEGERPGIFSSNMFGTMFLNLEDLSIEIIAHECGHAAFVWEFCVRRYTGTFDDDGMDEQEAYCYFLGATVRKVADVIRKNFKGVRL